VDIDADVDDDGKKTAAGACAATSFYFDRWSPLELSPGDTHPVAVAVAVTAAAAADARQKAGLDRISAAMDGPGATTLE